MKVSGPFMVVKPATARSGGKTFWKVTVLTGSISAGETFRRQEDAEEFAQRARDKAAALAAHNGLEMK